MAMNRYPVPYWQFVLDNFSFARHRCGQTCSCHGVGCKEHWVCKESSLPDRQQMCTMLGTWQAFRNKPGCREAFLQNFREVRRRVGPVSDLTLFCDWAAHEAQLAEVYDWMKGLFQNSTVCTTKTLHSFVPDMFIILDRAQVWRPWRQEMKRLGYHMLGGNIDDVDGDRYVSLLKAVKEYVSNSIRNQQAVTLHSALYPGIIDVRALRLIHPLTRPVHGGSPETHPNTIGKVLDNIMR